MIRIDPDDHIINPSSDRISIQVLEDPVALCAAELSAAVDGGGHVILTGGSSPVDVYKQCASRRASEWQGANIWFTDDRSVGPEDPLSNYRLVMDTLVDPLAASGVNVAAVHRMCGELGPEAGAVEYREQLASVFPALADEQLLADSRLNVSAPALFELALIGIGSDGHICSLFPGQPALDENTVSVVGVDEAGLEPYVPRITLTFATLARAKRALVLVTGEAKADVVSAAFAHDSLPDSHVPASLLAKFVPRVTVLLDDDAASRL